MVRGIFINYKSKEKEVLKKAPALMKKFGISDEDIKKCLNDINEENKIRDKVIKDLKKRYDLCIERELFPVIVYAIDIDTDNRIYINHDCSRWIWIYTDENINRISYDPLDNNCFDDICNHIDNILMTKDIKI